MKKYNKPIISIEDVIVSNVISTSSLTNIFKPENAAGDQSIDFSDFGSNEWN